jgi:hypothetical protein
MKSSTSTDIEPVYRDAWPILEPRIRRLVCLLPCHRKAGNDKLAMKKAIDGTSYG